MNHDLDIKDGIKSWETIGNAGVPVYYLYYYYPKDSFPYLDGNQDWARRFVWNFKKGENVDEAARQVTEVLRHFFLQETLSDMTLVCIPASSQSKYEDRYEEFSSIVCNNCDMWNGFDYIEVDYSREAKHLGGDTDYDNISIDSSFFRGKTVILLDDLITKGDSIKIMKRMLTRKGAKVVGAITIGRTVHHERGSDPYDEMNWKIKKQKTGTSSPRLKASESAYESEALFRRYDSVSRVARERGLSESTVYGHLFSTGMLDPDNYISDYDYRKAISIYESGYENASSMLDEFLDVAAKSAFYHKRRNR